MLSYNLSDRGNLSLYEYLYRCIREDIVTGTLDPDDRLPSKRRLAEHLGVSLVTVEGAYAQLVAEGYVYTQVRRGYYVAKLPSRAAPTAAAHPADRARATHKKDEHTNCEVIADFSHPSTHAGSSAAALWAKALRGALVQEPAEELFSTPSAQGSWRLRSAIAAYLAEARGMAADPECIVVGAGAQVLYGVIAMLAGPGAVVGVEDPGYPRMRATYRAYGLDVCPVELDAEGISMAGLEAAGASLVHVMPSHQFPTGRLTSIARRYELLGWASRAEGRWIVEDDYDWEFRLAGRPIPSLASIDAEGRVIYISTFSKSLSAALRMAFAVLPPELVEQLAASGAQAGTVSAIDQIALARLLESGDYERHLARYRKQSRDLRDAFVDALQSGALAGRIAIEEADSGLHFVLSVKTHQREAEIADRARMHGVVLAPLSKYVERALPAEFRDGKARFVMQYDGLAPAMIEQVVRVIEEAVGNS